MDLPDEVHQEVRAVAGFAYGAVGADIHVFGDGTPVYLLYARDTHGAADTLRRDSAWLRAQPSRMLDTRSEIVEFTGREAELARLREWREQPDRSAVRWLHGPGGAGKSRLAARFAAECADAGWLVVDAVHGTDTHPPAEGSQDLRTGNRAGVLLLVDYADRWPDAHLRWLFHNGLLGGELPARILLIARTVRPWPALRAQLGRQRRATDLSDQPLEPLSGRQGERSRMFEAARRSFAAHYPDPAALDGLRPPYEDLARPDFGLTLAVHMAALVAVDARAGGREPPAGLAGMTAYLLDREHDNWRRPGEHDTPGPGGAHPAGAEDGDRRALDLARTVFTAVLTGPMRRDTARPLLDRLLLRTPADRILSAHAVHYPPTDPAAAHVLEPLLPDRLAEDYLALTLPGSPVTGYPTDLWSVTATTRVLQRDGGAAPAWTPRALTFLIAAAERWPHIGPAVLFPLLRRDPALAVRGGGSVLTSLATLDSVDLDVLEAIEPLVPPGDVRVEDGGADLAVRLATHRLEGTADGMERARLCSQLVTAHLKADRRGEALPYMEEALRLTRQAAEEDPAHRPAYGDALLNLGGLFLKEIAAEDRVDLLQEAIPLLLEGGERDEDGGPAPTALGALAQAHTRLALAFWETGAPERAHEAVAEAQRLFEEVLDHDPFLWWSMSSDVNRLEMVKSFLLSVSGRSDEAAEGAGAVVAYARQMAELNPARFGDDLAGSLGIQSLHLWNAGRHAESVDMHLEALHLYRQLAEVRPHYRDVLASQLDGAAARLIALGRHTEAVAIAEESLALHRERLARDPDSAAADAERAAIGRALLYLRERRGADRLPWGTAAEIDDAAEHLVRAADRAGLWDLMRGVPVTDAIRIAHRHPPEHWAPHEDGPGRILAARLGSRRHRPQTAERTARAAAGRAVWHLPRRDGPVAPDRVSFAPGAPVMTRESYRPPGRGRPRDEYATRIEVHDLASRSLLWSADHIRVGTAPVTCLGPDAVLALRTILWLAPELVLYRPGRAEVLASGPDLIGARTFATARGFVVLLSGGPVALFGAADRPLERIDLRDLGLERCTVHAVDPTGQRIMLAGDRRVILTDAELRPLSARGWWGVPEQHGTVDAAAFLSPHEFVTAASTGGVYCFEQDSDRTMVTAWNTAGPRLEHLFAVPGWRVLGGQSRGEGAAPYFHDAVGLAAVPQPRPLAGPARGGPHAVTAAPGGRHVVHGTAVHDLGDPLSFTGRPLASLTAADRAALGAYLDGGRAPYAAIRELLELVRDLASPL
ncbi:tetratricopeptide repeat protein [Streptomyces sp. NPDC057011]|uniref:tetratricopeptide repeat protein n=1 Tax=unclassified Streptomyces TaxID=2593676 RepID=UPI0036413923